MPTEATTIPTSLMDFEVYKAAIENLATSKSSYVFENGGAVHGAIVMGNIFKSASDNVKIFCGDFNGDVSDNPYYLNSLKCYLNKKRPLTVIFENEPNSNSKALKLIKESECLDLVTINRLNSKIDDLIDVHFTIADGRMFRIETSKNNYKAVCSFNSPEIVSTFEKRFQELSNLSVPV